MNTPTTPAIHAARALSPGYLLHIAEQGAPGHGQVAREDIEHRAKIIDETTALPDLLRLAEICARLNPKAGEIGDGMLATIHEAAHRALNAGPRRVFPDARTIREIPAHVHERLLAIETAARAMDAVLCDFWTEPGMTGDRLRNAHAALIEAITLPKS